MPPRPSKPCANCGDLFGPKSTGVGTEAQCCSVECAAEHRRLDRTEKACGSCGIVKPLDEFDLRRDRPDGRQNNCKTCHTEVAYNNRLKSQFHITREQYDAMLEAQGGVCAICKQVDVSGRKLSVDHDHACCPEKSKSCGECVRGLLCGHCNHGIGKFRDNPDLLRTAIAYLENA